MLNMVEGIWNRVREVVKRTGRQAVAGVSALGAFAVGTGIAPSAALPTTYDAGALTSRYTPAASSTWSTSWTPDAIRAARTAQMAGDYRRSALLGVAIKTDPSIYGTILNRVAPHRGLPRAITCSSEAVRLEAEVLFGVGPKASTESLQAGVVADGYEALALFGKSVEQIVWTKSADGARLIPRLETWPMSSVWEDRYTGRTLTTTTKGIVEIVHGDGHWVVTTLHSSTPWQWGAVMCVGESWGHRAQHRRDRLLNSETHGEGKFIGTLPETMAALDPAAAEFALALKDLRKRRSSLVVPPGGDVKLLEGLSQMWQIFSQAFSSIDKDVARAFLGQDGSMVNEGGNYIKSAILSGVRNDIVEGDLSARGEALTSGLLRVWAIVNFGEDFGIHLRWTFPDLDQESRIAAYGSRLESFNKGFAALKANGFLPDNDYAQALAKRFDIEVPELPARVMSITLAPTDQVRYVSPNEARASMGGEPALGLDGLPDPRGDVIPALAAPEAPPPEPEPPEPEQPPPAPTRPPGEASAGFFGDIRDARAGGARITRPLIDALAALHGVPAEIAALVEVEA